MALFCILAALTAHAAEDDPFKDIEPSAPQAPVEKTPGFFSDNFGFRKELMSEFGTIGPGRSSSRQSVGFETQKKFSTEVKTYLGIDVQGRVVRRDGFVGTPNDMEGMSRRSWTFEYHNAYADAYDLFGDVGRFNARIGRFYVPFGLNLQTDTHGTILQLSNERNFGFERDWYAGFWGSLSDDLRYDVDYLAGTGYDLKFKGQHGLGAARVGLANKYLSEYGLEGGVSAIGGERLGTDDRVVYTSRAGLDGRYRKSIPTGLLTWTSELSGGSDSPDTVTTQLHQLDYLNSSRRWGLASQFRWFSQEAKTSDTSLLAEATWYFNNDVSNSNLQWIKLNCEFQLARMNGDKDVITTLQYYRYW